MAAAGGVLQHKLTYRPQRKLEVFFTGGTVRVSRDGQLLACSCGDEVKIVELATGAVVKTLAGDSEPVTSLAVSPDARTLVVASRSQSCRTYDISTGELLRTWRPHKAPVTDVAIDASGGYVATASADRTIKVWDLQGGFCTHSFVGHSGVVLRVLWHPKRLELYSGGDDAEIRVWDLAAKTCKALLKSHFSAVTALALSSDGWTLVSGGRDKVVTTWDLRTMAKAATIPVYESVEGVVTLPPGAPFPGVPTPSDPSLVGAKAVAKPVFFATAGDKGCIRVWRSDTASCVFQGAGLGPGVGSAAGSSAAQEYTDLQVLPGGQGLLATTADARIMTYRQDEAKSGLALDKQLVGNVDEVTDVRLVGGSPAAPTHVAVATNCEVIQLFDVQSLSCAASCLGHTDTVLALDAAHGVGPDGSGLLVSGGKDNSVMVWSMPSGRRLAVGVGHVGSVSAVALARKHPTRFVVSAGADKLLKVWDLEAALDANAHGREAEAQQPQKKAKKGAAATAAAAARSAAIAPGAVVDMRVTAATSAHDKDINSVAVSPNDALVATGSQDKTARVWKLPSLTPHMVLRGHKRGVWAVEFSPVDQALLTASGDKTIRMWALAEGGTCIRTFTGHTASVLRATFLTAGTQVMSAGADGLVKLWSLKSDECVATFDEHEGKIWALTTGGAGESMAATGGADATVCVWADTTASDAVAAEEAEHVLVGKEQALANALVAGDFQAAAKLAFELRHPGRLLEVVQRAAAGTRSTAPNVGLLGSASTAVVAGQATSDLLAQLVRHMGDDDVRVALQYCREWNTNARHCHAAQAMLRALLRARSPAQVLALPGAGELVDGLLAYSTRHFARVDRLLRSTRLLDYSLAAMQVFTPEGGIGAEEGAGATTQGPGPSAQQLAPRLAQHSKSMNGGGHAAGNGLMHGDGTMSGSDDSHSDGAAQGAGNGHGNGLLGSDADTSSEEEKEAGDDAQRQDAQAASRDSTHEEQTRPTGGSSSGDDDVSLPAQPVPRARRASQRSPGQGTRGGLKRSNAMRRRGGNGNGQGVATVMRGRGARGGAKRASPGSKKLRGSKDA